jgi:hypothetical protein
MSTINFSVPEEIKKAFQETFADENRSAIIARLMQDAVEERQRQKRRAAAIDALIEFREHEAPVGAAELEDARKFGRP